MKNNYKFVKNFYIFEGRETFTGVVQDKDNNIAYYLNGQLHREDGPAIEYGHFSKSWYLNGNCYGKNNYFTNESWIRFVKLELLK